MLELGPCWLTPPRLFDVSGPPKKSIEEDSVEGGGVGGAGSFVEDELLAPNAVEKSAKPSEPLVWLNV